MREVTCIIFMLFMIPCSVFADINAHKQSLENISKQLPKLESIKCNFKQEKYFKNVQNPVVSVGQFEFIKGYGVSFTTIYPIKSKTDYTNKNYKQINDVINAITSKKYSKIEKEFDFYFEKNSQNIELVIRPKTNSQSADFISSITLFIKDYIQKIEIKQTNGNKTVLWFTK